MVSYLDSSSPPLVLCFGASDPSCGSGIQSDVLTLAAQGVHPLTVVTSISIQDTAGVEATQAIDGDWVSDQARALLEDMPVSAFKIGTLGGIDCVEAVAEVLSDYPDVPVVFDPSLRAEPADPLEDEELSQAVWELLVPLSTIMTLSSREVLHFSPEGLDDAEEDGVEVLVEGDADVATCARHLIITGARHVLVTGTHEQTPQVVNTLFGPLGVIRADAWERLPGRFNGAGATLSAAIAALLARGVDLSEAVHEAQRFTWEALAHGWRLGMGRTVPNRLHGGVRA